MRGAKVVLPFLQYSGQVTVHSDVQAINVISDQLCSACQNGPMYVGFDCEWDVVTRPVFRQSKVAVVQICLNESVCHLFHLSPCNYVIPEKLRDLISHPNLIKVGLNVSGDIFRLHKDYGIKSDFIVSGTKRSVIELSQLVNQIYKLSENWSLDRLTQYILKKQLNKAPGVRLSKWSQVPLEEEQLLYAATDAYAAWLIHETVMKDNLQNQTTE